VYVRADLLEQRVGLGRVVPHHPRVVADLEIDDPPFAPDDRPGLLRALIQLLDVARALVGRKYPFSRKPASTPGIMAAGRSFAYDVRPS